MDKVDLISCDFWKSEEADVMTNPRDQKAVSEAKMIQSWLSQEQLLRGHLLFSTSGSTGSGKWVALSRSAILASARTVNDHLKVSVEDRWLLALPDFHVGGLGVYARCYEASCDLVKLEGKWNAKSFHRLTSESAATLSALVPTQLVDLVQLGLKAPPSLRALIIGGGRLEDSVYEKAVMLGWPIMETYGMTETCSQVATAELADRAMKLLPLWQAKLSEDGKLMLYGESLMAGYVSSSDGVCQFQPHDSWLVTNDLVELENNTLKVLGRSDRCVKILGELVNLAEVESALTRCSMELGLTMKDFAVITVPHPREGAEMILCHEGGNADELEGLLTQYNQSCAPFKAMKNICEVDEIPRSALGKVRYAELSQQVMQSDR